MGDSQSGELLGAMTVSVPPPSPSEQIRFLQQVQRILEEGSFVATYKYALLHSLADLCVKKGRDTGEPLTLSTEELAEGFIDLYWRQTAPFPADEPGVLRQNTGRQAAIVRQISEVRESFGGSLARFREHSNEWSSLLGAVEHIVRKMPLWRLQTVGDQQVEFLYKNVGRGRSITLKPGVAFCFRAFHPMLSEMLEGAWSQFVRRQNRSLLGTRTELRSFLFGTDRALLAHFRPMLLDIQSGRCFYCERHLSARADVDHFIPWSRYPTDLGHNFVLAHQGCNNSKRDRLAAEIHLRNWRERNEVHRVTLEDRFREAGIVHDLRTTIHIARWAYGQAHRAEGQGWIQGDTLEPISPEWETILNVA